MLMSYYLPSDVLKIIFSYFTPSQQALARFVCHRWRVLIPPPECAITLKCYIDNDQIFDWAWRNRCPEDPDILVWATSRGSLNIITNYPPRIRIRDPRWITDAAYYGHIHVLEAAFLKGHDLSPCYEAAARGGKRTVLKWLYINGIRTQSERPCLEAARVGFLKTLKWLHEHHFPWNAECYQVALNHKHILEYLQAEKCPLS